MVSTNPFATPEVYNVAMLRLLYPTLVVRDRQAKIVPWAADKVRIVDDTTVDITLRSGMKFHDGKPVTAEDLKFTIDFIIENKFPALARIADAVASVEVTGQESARIKVEETVCFLRAERAQLHVYRTKTHMVWHIRKSCGLSEQHSGRIWSFQAEGMA